MYRAIGCDLHNMTGVVGTHLCLCDGLHHRARRHKSTVIALAILLLIYYKYLTISLRPTSRLFAICRKHQNGRWKQNSSVAGIERAPRHPTCWPPSYSIYRYATSTISTFRLSTCSLHASVSRLSRPSPSNLCLLPRRRIPNLSLVAF